jgi:hypothetical protein
MRQKERGAIHQANKFLCWKCVEHPVRPDPQLRKDAYRIILTVNWSRSVIVNVPYDGGMKVTEDKLDSTVNPSQDS